MKDHQGRWIVDNSTREEDVNECFGAPAWKRRKDRLAKPGKYGSS
jgi:hypothetical protein